MKNQVLTDAERRQLLYATLKDFGYEITLKPYFGESVFGYDVWLKAPYKEARKIACFSSEYTVDEIIESAHLENYILNNVHIKFIQRWELS